MLGKSVNSEVADLSAVILEDTPYHWHVGLCLVPLSDRLRSCSANSRGSLHSSRFSVREGTLPVVTS